MFIDLHTHTTASDGQYSPAELVGKARNAGVQLLAITDHDTVNGLEEGSKHADKVGLRFVPGIEISAQDMEEIHILGYGIDRTNPELLDACQHWSLARSNRGEVIKRYLNTRDIDIDLEVVKSYAGNGNLGRPHFAKYLVEIGVVESRKEAFDKYLDTEEFKKATDRKKPKCVDAIELIHGAGGKAVLAHPGNYKRIGDDGVAELMVRLVENGLDGIECFYSKHSKTQTEYYLSLAKQYSIKASAGSDFHGESVKPDISLGIRVEDSYKDNLFI